MAPRQVIFYPVDETNIYPIVFNPLDSHASLKGTFWEHDHYNLYFDSPDGSRAWLYFKNEIRKKRKLTAVELTRQRRVFWANRQEARRRLCFYRKPLDNVTTSIIFNIDQLPPEQITTFWQPPHPQSNPLRIVLERLGSDDDDIIVKHYNSNEKMPRVYRTDLQSVSGEIWYEDETGCNKNLLESSSSSAAPVIG